jgi:hypothetical protein
MLVNANYLRRQAEILLVLARGTFDLTIAMRLRGLAREFEEKAEEIDDENHFPEEVNRGTSSRQFGN